jgi:hypothetical protein
VAHLRSLADQISGSAAAANSSYTKLLKLSTNDASSMELYAGFIADVGNDQDEAAKVRTRAKEIRVRAEKSSPRACLIDESSAILTVDATMDLSCGEIIGANLCAGRIFNQRSDYLLGRNIASILLAPISSNFHDIITRFLELGDETFFKTVFHSYFRLEQALHLVPCFLELRPYTQDGIAYKIYVSVRDICILCLYDGCSFSATSISSKILSD